MDANLVALDRDPRQADRVHSLREWVAREFARCEPTFVERKSAGKIREGHGDMHLGNMILRYGEIQVFDCLEFNPGLRWIDVISEVAFLVMDLADRGRPDLGWRFHNEWLQHTGDYAGMQVWAWYFVYRALVRAKVSVLRRQQPDVTEHEVQLLDRELTGYLTLAQDVTQRQPPKLFLTHGVSGSGKSFWARRLAAEQGWIWIRSDVERKRLFTSDTETGTQIDDLYSSEMSERTYRHLRDVASTAIRNGWSIVVDAVFLTRSQRQPFRDLADELKVTGCVLAFHADEATLQTRITDRKNAGGDPSDATLDVLSAQLKKREPPQAYERWTIIEIDTQSPHAGEHLTTALNDL